MLVVAIPLCYSMHGVQVYTCCLFLIATMLSILHSCHGSTDANAGHRCLTRANFVSLCETNFEFDIPQACHWSLVSLH